MRDGGRRPGPDVVRSPVTVAHGLLSRWSAELGYVAAAITYRRRGDQGQRVLANGGYAVPVAQYLAREFVDDTRIFDHIRVASRRPVCWEDVPDFELTSAVEDVLRPSGFREGSSVALGLERGQVTSVLHVSFTRSQVDSTVRPESRRSRGNVAASSRIRANVNRSGSAAGNTRYSRWSRRAQATPRSRRNC